MIPTSSYDPYWTYRYGQSLVNPDHYKSLGTQISCSTSGT
jgi:hypothetical protein